MDIKINGVSFTSKVNRDSLKIREYGAYRSDVSFIVEFDGVFSGGIKAGMEVKITETSGSSETLIWGGVIEKVTANIVSSDFYTVGVFAKGYETLVSRRVEVAIDTTFSGAAAAFRYVHANHLRYEGITLDSTIKDKVYPLELNIGGAISLTELLDIICSYYGYVWWIDKNKRFHAAETIAVTESDIQINLNMTNSLGIIDATFAESLEEYRNVQYISLNANTQYAFVENEDAIEAMKAYIGSGEFSKVGRKSRIIDHDHGKGLAAKMLANFNEPPMFIRFTEDFSGGYISLFSRVTVSSTFLNGTKPFVVTGIVRNYRYGKIFTTVTGYAFSGTAYMPIINTLKTVSFTI